MKKSGVLVMRPIRKNEDQSKATLFAILFMFLLPVLGVLGFFLFVPMIALLILAVIGYLVYQAARSVRRLIPYWQYS